MGTPQRTCVGCRTVRSQDELIRLHLDADGALAVSRTGEGRGAWLCRGTVLSCFDLAATRNGFSRSLRENIRAESVVALRQELERTQQ